MSLVQKDLILRAIEQLAQALARVAALVAGQKHEEALAELDEAELALIGPQLRSLARLDSTSAALMLHSPERVRSWALLIAQRARVLAQLKRPGEALSQAKRARALFSSAERSGAALSDADRAALREIEAIQDQ